MLRLGNGEFSERSDLKKNIDYNHSPVYMSLHNLVIKQLSSKYSMDFSLFCCSDNEFEPAKKRNMQNSRQTQYKSFTQSWNTQK